MNAYEILRDACATLSDRGNTPMMRAKGGRAIAALAELERAAAEPVAWMWNDEIGVPHASAGSKKPVWLESSASAEYIKQANLRPLYAAPPAPVAPQYVAGEIDDAMIERVFQRAAWDFADGSTRVTYKMLQAWRSELGPTLGLVELKEPTPEECERIENQFTVLNMRLETPTGRDMFDSVRAVLWQREVL